MTRPRRSTLLRIAPDATSRLATRGVCSSNAVLIGGSAPCHAGFAERRGWGFVSWIAAHRLLVAVLQHPSSECERRGSRAADQISASQRKKE
jgi:hypothetical protein